MGYRVELLPDAAKQLKKLDGPVRDRIRALIDCIQSLDNPRSIGEALHGNLSAYWKYRAGDWRIVASVHDKFLVVEVIEIEHRSKAY